MYLGFIFYFHSHTHDYSHSCKKPTPVSPAIPGQQQQYIIKSGDTLSEIAQRYLGNANRWREIKKADGGTFTDAEARNLAVGLSVYLPVSYRTNPTIPVTTPPTPTPTRFAVGINSVSNADNGFSSVYPNGQIRVSGNSSTSNMRFYLGGTELEGNLDYLTDGSFTAVLRIPEYLQDKGLAVGTYPIRVVADGQTVYGPSIDITLNYDRSDTTLEYMYQEMVTNAQSSLVEQLRYYNNLPFGIGKIYALSGWGILTAPYGVWDHKPKLEEKLGFKNDGSEWFRFPIRGDSEHEFFYDIWSNIHFGYVGRSAGFDRDTLQRGAGIPGLAGTNDKGDVLSVDIGVDLWEGNNRFGTSLTVEQLRLAILGYVSDFLKIGNDDPDARKVFPIDNGR